jgi:hypothetical protein
MEMRNVWVAFVFAPLPVKNWTANSFVVNYVFDPLVTAFGDFANLLDYCKNFFGVRSEVSIYIDRSDNSASWYMVRIALCKVASISNPAIRLAIAIRIIIINLLPKLLTGFA